MNKSEPMHILSLGAGVQSSALALMATHGEITPMPDIAIFSDTHAEPQEVYEWLDWLENKVSFPIVQVSHRDLKNDITKERLPIPAWIQLKDEDRSGGLLNRICTSDYKINPLIREVRKQLGIFGKRTPEGVLAIQWIGISLDEIQRMKNSRNSFIEHRWPLIENRLTRLHCIEWVQKHYKKTPPRSACTFCPFHDNKEWRHIRDDYPEEWQDAIKIDKKIRTMWRGKDSEASFFLHRSKVPLEEADLSEPNEGQFDLFGFENECDGMCGV
mgnify:CR=1 FL=1